MILTLMLVILTATLVIVIIGFVMDRLEMRKIQGGMRTLNKRIKRLERVKYTVEGCYVQMDSDIEAAIQEETGGDIPAETDDTIQTTGD